VARRSEVAHPKRRPFDPARLFAPYREPRARSRGSVFDDLVAGRRAVLRSSANIRDIEAGAPYFTELVDAAMDRNLAVVVRPARGAPRGVVTVYVLKLDQVWRVPALETLRATAFVDGRWSDAAEQQEQLLFGLSAKERALSLAEERERKAAWTCCTVYTLLSQAERRVVVGFGKRCFAPEVQGMAVFIEGSQVLKRNALALVPKGFTLARAGLAWTCAWQLFPRGTTELQARVPAGVDLNANLVSSVQFLTRTGWK
jgi:hypothetical protein